MSQATTATVSSIDRYLFPVATQARTDEEFWEMFKGLIRKSRFQETEGLNTSTSMKTDWSELFVGSTALIRVQEERIREELEVLFLSYDNEDFEDGMGNDFVKELKFYILRYVNKAVHAIANIIARRHTNPQVISEALRWLGGMSHPESYQSRLFLLEKSLYNPSRWIRDGAALGLASMNDVHAIPYLHEAIKREKIQDLQEDLQTILIRLERLL